MTCRRRSGIGAVALFALGLASFGAVGSPAADQPPRDLHLRGDHWTAWDPPTEFPPGAEVYTIVAGDTLWAIAGKYLKNSYLWPQLWEQNQYIKDAHWIYPGDPLVVSLEVAPVEQVEQLSEQDLGGASATGASGQGTAQEPLPGIDTALAPLQPLGSEDDIYCSGYVGEIDEQFGYHLVGSEYNTMSPSLAGFSGGRQMRGIYGVDTVKFDLTIGDVVYVDGGMAAGLSPGVVYMIVMPREVVRNPATNEVVGRIYQYQGRLRLLAVQDRAAIGEIIQACDSILAGTGLKPFVPEPVPLGRRTGVRPANAPVAAEELDDSAVILRGKDTIISFGEDHVVFVTLGADSGAVPGDVYTIYRLNAEGLPPLVLGELAVLSVHPRGAVARILASRYPIYAGDRLEPK
jgi:hypothetical protein